MQIMYSKQFDADNGYSEIWLSLANPDPEARFFGRVFGRHYVHSV